MVRSKGAGLFCRFSLGCWLLVGLCQRAERPRRVRAEAPCGGFRTVVSPIPYWLTTVQSVDFFLADDNLDALKSTV